MRCTRLGADTGGGAGGGGSSWLGGTLQSFAVRAGLNISVRLNNVVVKYVEPAAYTASLTFSSLLLCTAADDWRRALQVGRAGRGLCEVGSFGRGAAAAGSCVAFSGGQGGRAPRRTGCPGRLKLACSCGSPPFGPEATDK